MMSALVRFFRFVQRFYDAAVRFLNHIIRTRPTTRAIRTFARKLRCERLELRLALTPTLLWTPGNDPNAVWTPDTNASAYWTDESNNQPSVWQQGAEADFPAAGSCGPYGIPNENGGLIGGVIDLPVMVR